MEPDSGVYVLRVAETDNYKIGMSSKVDKRVGYWHRSLPVLDLEEVAIFYTEHARKLEAALHKRFAEHRFEGSEWFELSSGNEKFFEQETEDLISLFSISGNGRPEGPYSTISGLPKPIDPIGEDEESEPIEPKEPEKLRRIEQGETIADEDRPTYEDEFQLGLLPEIRKLYDEMGTWEAVGEHYDIPKEEVWYIAKHEVQPTDNETRHKLGLSGWLTAYDFLPPEGIE